MNSIRDKKLILNYIFIFGIVILFLNDHFFKFYYSNFLTGKLSDICGIIIFPLFLTYIFPKLKERSVFLACTVFIFWKSEYSQSLIDLYNKYSFIQTSRIIDYSDLLVLIFLPFPYYLIKNIETFENLTFKKVNPKLVFIPSLLIFIAESPPPSFYYTMNDGNLKCHNCNITINKNKNYIVEKLNQNGIAFDTIKALNYKGVIDSINGAKKYFKRELILDKDTLRNIDLTIVPLKDEKTRIYFNGMDVSENLKNDKKLEKKLRKYYRKIIFDEIKQSLK